MTKSKNEIVKPQINYGIHLNIPIEEYHNWQKYPAISSSQLKTATKESLAHVKYAMDNPQEDAVETKLDARSFGNISHQILLENAISDYLLQPAEIKTRRGKAWDEFKAQAETNNKQIIREKELEQLILMHDSLMAVKEARNLIETKSHVELSGFWKHDLGFDCKLRLDMAELNDYCFVADYKSAKDASERGIEQAFWSYGYDQQAAWYLDGLKKIFPLKKFIFYFIFQEKKPPYAVNVKYVSNDIYSIGKVRNLQAANLVSEALTTGVWTGYQQGETIKIPYWIEGQIESILGELNDAE